VPKAPARLRGKPSATSIVPVVEGPLRAGAPGVHMIKLTEKREITPYKWVHPDKERRGRRNH
jgi:hypothetical protein